MALQPITVRPAEIISAATNKNSAEFFIYLPGRPDVLASPVETAKVVLVEQCTANVVN
jgi:hypothetical protein